LGLMDEESVYVLFGEGDAKLRGDGG